MEAKKQNAFEMMMRAAKNQEHAKSTTAKRSGSTSLQHSPKKRCLDDSSTAATTAEATQHAQHSIAGRDMNTVEGSFDRNVLEDVDGIACSCATAKGSQPSTGSPAPVAPVPHQELCQSLVSGQSPCLWSGTQQQTRVAATAAEPQSSCLQQQQQQQQQQQRLSAASDKQHAATIAAFRSVFQGQSASARQKYDYLAVYDLEATCNRARSLHPVEIIELSCVLVDIKSAQVTSSFQAYVRPTEHPQLDPFCVQLTGIQQHQIDNAQPLQEVLQHHHTWLEQQGMFKQGIKFLAVTWTDWDFAVCLCAECAWRRIQRPDYLCSWVDLKRQFYASYKQRGNLRTCVEAAGLRWQGRAHSGLDDATNTARLAIKLLTRGTVFDVTQTSENPPSQQQLADTPSSGGSSFSRMGSSKSSSRGKAAAPGSRSSRGLMCNCGVKAQLRTTKRPGPNHGRQFYSCGTWTITAQQSRGCGFFVWTDDLTDG